MITMLKFYKNRQDLAEKKQIKSISEDGHINGGVDVRDVEEQTEEAVTEPQSDREVGKLDPMIHGFFKPTDDKSLKHPNCDVCRQAKLRKKPQKHHSLFQNQESKLGRIFSTDLKKVVCRSFHGYGYVMCFIEQTKDGSPGIAFHYLMKNKSETTAKLLQFIQDCEKLGIKIAKIQSDRGSEFFEQEGVGGVFDERALHRFRATCQKHNIDHTVTPVEDKEKYAERWIKEHFKAVDVLLWNARAAPQFWSYALDYSVSQYNRTPVKVGEVWYKSPHQYYTGEVPRWDKWKVFGCDAFSVIPNNKLKKVPGLPNGKRSMFVGFDKDGGYLLFDLDTRKHFHSSNVYFNESFINRHNALHYFDQRRQLQQQDKPQPLVVNDFEAAQAEQVRNLYMSPDAIVKASTLAAAKATKRKRASVRSSNAGIGGDGVNVNDTVNNETTSDTSTGNAGGFLDSLIAEEEFNRMRKETQQFAHCV
jgi:hypothetical protein